MRKLYSFTDSRGKLFVDIGGRGMTTLGIQCPFCHTNLKMEIYLIRKKPSITVYCDNDFCDVKPSTIDTIASAAFADVYAWGYGENRTSRSAGLEDTNHDT